MALKRLETGKFTKQIMEEYYNNARLAAEQGKKIAWCTALSPAEIFWAADIIPCFPENQASACGAKRTGPTLSELAEAAGLSQETCSYVRNDLGIRQGGPSPWGGMPRPDIVFCCNNSCQTVTKWYEDLQRHFGCELAILDMPYNFSGDITEHSVEYIVEQFKEVIKMIEKVTGRPYDYDRLKEVVRISKETSDYWKACLEMGMLKPSPITTTDILISMGPIVCLRGTEIGLEHYRRLYEEIKGRVDSGYAAVENEKFRLVWDNIPLWYALGDLVKKLAVHGGVLVGATYLYHWLLPLDPEKPLESMARAFSTSLTLNMSVEHKIDKISNIFDRYQADGMIVHSNRSCKPDALGSFDLQRAINDRLGKPVLIIEADHTDSRIYSEGPVFTRIEAFFEAMENAAV